MSWTPLGPILCQTTHQSARRKGRNQHEKCVVRATGLSQCAGIASGVSHRGEGGLHYGIPGVSWVLVVGFSLYHNDIGRCFWVTRSVVFGTIPTKSLHLLRGELAVFFLYLFGFGLHVSYLVVCRTSRAALP